MEKENNQQPENPLDEFGQYDPKLDLLGYQYPTLDIIAEPMRSALVDVSKIHSNYRMPLWLSAGTKPVLRELYHHPNVLLAGTIASGKTKFIYNQLVFWLFIRHPAQIKFMICRNKPVDYNSISKLERHFLAKHPSWISPFADTSQGTTAFNGLAIECEQRLSLFRKAGVKNIVDYNQLFITRQLDPEKGNRYLPDLICIIDDLSTFLNKDATDALIRLTQQNLYTGIYVIAVTSQIASRAITPQLRANFSVRIAMKLMSQSESRRLLDRIGAEKLTQPGELLYEQHEKLQKGFQPLLDYQCILNVGDYIGNQRGYPSAFLLPEYQGEGESGGVDSFDMSERDPMFEDAARLIVMHQQGSTSLIQRKLKLGYNRAGRIIDQLEAAGIVGPFEGSKAREVLYPDEYSLEQFLDGLSTGATDSKYLSPALSQNPKQPILIKKPKTNTKKKKTTSPKLQYNKTSNIPVINHKPKATNHNSGCITWGILLVLCAIIFLIGGWDVLLDWLKH